MLALIFCWSSKCWCSRRCRVPPKNYLLDKEVGCRIRLRRGYISNSLSLSRSQRRANRAQNRLLIGGSPQKASFANIQMRGLSFFVVAWLLVLPVGMVLNFGTPRDRIQEFGMKFGTEQPLLETSLRP